MVQERQAKRGGGVVGGVTARLNADHIKMLIETFIQRMGSTQDG
jgi:hypothetical protein